jgi:hypothetical protein
MVVVGRGHVINEDRSRNMAIDIDGMSPEAREGFLALGERYPTPNVLAQADKVLLGLALYGSILVLYGFGAEDAEDVSEARDLLRAEDSGKVQTASERKTISQNADDVIRAARQDRLTAITVLKSSRRILRQRGNKTVLALVQSALSRARVLGEEAELPTQMQLLHATLVDPAVAPVVASRGGPEVATRLVTGYPEVLAALRDRAGHPPSRAVGERRDILDGIVVTLARSARAAARMAARALGQPSIAAAFELVHLEPPRSRRAPAADDPGAPSEDPAAPAPPATAPPAPAGDVTPPA